MTHHWNYCYEAMRRLLLPGHTVTHARTDGRTTRKHNASGSIYWTGRGCVEIRRWYLRSPVLVRRTDNHSVWLVYALFTLLTTRRSRRCCDTMGNSLSADRYTRCMVLYHTGRQDWSECALAAHDRWCGTRKSATLFLTRDWNRLPRRQVTPQAPVHLHIGMTSASL